jgi:hypothetical protein
MRCETGLTGRHLRIRFTEAHHPVRRALRIRSLRRDADSRSRVVRAIGAAQQPRVAEPQQSCTHCARRASSRNALRPTIRTQRTQR